MLQLSKKAQTYHLPRTAPPNTPYSGDIWAPELHALAGRWWVYFAADNPAIGNASHRVFMLGDPPADTDPCALNARWDFLGPLRGLPNGEAQHGQWAIDLTVITLNNINYVVYSGWPWNYDKNWWVFRNDDTQQLWIARMSDPTTVDSKPVMISKPDHPWEFSGNHGINEGPQWLASPDGQWTGLVYSCSGSWTKDYKMATLRYLGGDPLDPRSWQKARKPLIEGARGRGPFGPGHGNFVHLGNEVIGVFHATDKPTDGWNGRKARAQKLIFGGDGEPYMGGSVGQNLSQPDGPHGHAQQGDPPESKGGLKGLLHGLKKFKDEL